MPHLLRKLETKATWTATAKDCAWLPKGEVQADALECLRTKDNKLSLWHIEEDRSNLNEVLASLAATRSVFQHIDYALFDATDFETSGFVARTSTASTANARANTQWHRDLEHLSASEIAKLASWIAGHAEFDRKFKGEVEVLVRQEIHAGHIDKDRVNKTLSQSLCL